MDLTQIVIVAPHADDAFEQRMQEASIARQQAQEARAEAEQRAVLAHRIKERVSDPLSLAIEQAMGRRS